MPYSLRAVKRRPREPRPVGKKTVGNFPTAPLVGVTRFELATLRPPDVYSNRTELHPELFQQRKDITNFRVVA